MYAKFAVRIKLTRKKSVRITTIALSKWIEARFPSFSMAVNASLAMGTINQRIVDTNVVRVLT